MLLIITSVSYYVNGCCCSVLENATEDNHVTNIVAIKCIHNSQTVIQLHLIQLHS